ncbi:MAG: ATP-grasp domain-containing protein [Actinomycetota bacterium]|nr:ATP-grasp domain-containing protein [Actinomycetota bacterium]
MGWPEVDAGSCGGALLRIWFNRTYATNSHVIAMLRANPDGRPVHVIGTHSDADSPVLAACDEAYPEPPEDCPAADYQAWALDFARQHDVHVLIPRLAMADLADARAEFSALGVRLLCPAGDTVRLFEDKAATYRAAEKLGLPVPPHSVVTDAEGLQAAYEQVRETADVVCMKPVRATGGDGFRILSTIGPGIADLVGPADEQIPLDWAVSALRAARDAGQHVPALLVMPFLSGPEVSVDALADSSGHTLAAVGRRKSRRRGVIVDDRPARRVAETLNAAHGVSYLSNTQVRYWQGPGDAEPRPYLLELNTRMSGGLFQTALAGVNLPWAALRLALGEDAGTLLPHYDVAFTTVSSLVALGASP